MVHCSRIQTGNDSPADSRSASPGRFFGFGRPAAPPKLPTLEGHPAYRPPPRVIPLGQSFRFKREYRGQQVRHSTIDVFEESDDEAFVDRLKTSAQNGAGLPPRAPPRRLRRAAHSAPPKSARGGPPLPTPPPPDFFEDALNVRGSRVCSTPQFHTP